jgi:hypothetical protein
VLELAWIRPQTLFVTAQTCPDADVCGSTITQDGLLLVRESRPFATTWHAISDSSAAFVRFVRYAAGSDGERSTDLSTGTG